MSKFFPFSEFSPKEEIWNIRSHTFALCLSIIGLFSILYAFQNVRRPLYLGLIYYACSLILVFSCSVLTHSAQKTYYRSIFNLLDFIAIDLLILATYFPILHFQLTQLAYLWYIILALACCSILAKLLFRGKAIPYSILSYVVMGTAWLWHYKSFVSEIDSFHLNFLTLGFFAYLIGLIFFKLEQIPYNHAIFHFFVLLGASFHFFEIVHYRYA